MKRMTSASMPEVVRMASLTPAERAGIAGEVGSLEPGKLADLVVLDARMKVRRVFVEGAEVLAKTQRRQVSLDLSN